MADDKKTADDLKKADDKRTRRIGSGVFSFLAGVVSLALLLISLKFNLREVNPYVVLRVWLFIAAAILMTWGGLRIWHVLSDRKLNAIIDEIKKREELEELAKDPNSKDQQIVEGASGTSQLNPRSANTENRPKIEALRTEMRRMRIAELEKSLKPRWYSRLRACLNYASMGDSVEGWENVLHIRAI